MRVRSSVPICNAIELISYAPILYIMYLKHIIYAFKYYIYIYTHDTYLLLSITTWSVDPLQSTLTEIHLNQFFARARAPVETAHTVRQPCGPAARAAHYNKNNNYFRPPKTTNPSYTVVINRRPTLVDRWKKGKTYDFDTRTKNSTL